MKFLRSIGLAALLMVGASSASAQVYYDMVQMTSQSGYRSEIYETVTTADFLRAPANGVQRLAFTKGSAFTATVYACETKSPADPATAGTCTSVATLSATNPNIEITTGRAWLIVDVTAAETAGNVSYLTIRSHSTEHASGGKIIRNLADNIPNPNDSNNDLVFDDPVLCSASWCFFQSSMIYGGGWWSWTGDGWGSMNEQILLSNTVQGSLFTSTTSYLPASDCADVRQASEIDSFGRCDNNVKQFRYNRPVFITQMCASTPVILSGTRSAGLRLAYADGRDPTTNDPIAVEIATLNLPPSNAQISSLTPVCININVRVSKLALNLLAGQSAFCAAETGCVFNANTGDVHFEIYGVSL